MSDLKRPRKTCRSLILLIAGAVLSVLIGGRVDQIWMAFFWAFVVGFAYFPLARTKCPSCKKFPFKYVLNIGAMPLLCFWPNQKCGHCGEKLVV
jgi:uncharacterized membrane protein YjjP (DUF1212 family)